MAVVSDDTILKKGFLLPGDIVSILLALTGLPIITVFFYQRLQNARTKHFTVASVTLLLSYLFTFLFIYILTILVHLKTVNKGVCDSTLVICLTLYVVTKGAGFLFLIERAYIISWPVNPRWKTPEYVLSCVLIFCPYTAVAGFCTKNRIAYNNEHDVCIIGIQMFALVPLLVVEVVSYLYLTIRFLVPLIMVHFGGAGGLLIPLRKVVLKTFIGTAITMLSTLAVKVSLTLFNGEPAWLCCLTCKVDAIIAAAVLHWITVPDHTGEGEHGSPQALGIGFDKSTTEASPGSSGSRGTAPDSPREFDLKDVL
ncbi:hypothetical protein CLAFUW4_12287 [Fulvia fulva]|uniref:Uncharacterized protein n=1 Tax=Passalora fulva TaxID=5499 RepID=A0A9Q8PDX7_PASFU|nr:uncharacterized protein CLAFUR5_11317 [Fulvia fulva]KAK4618170.1 hypothetical protein CLAFUR4_12292 [Fulvia fulva]KAK4618464.1 hypothetical protein CLAFUR0_12303 [Fulvia fulva]UJO20632.1 hypothetical protein CLAFUR5_11317 [Fulvia fulva]WPV17927.1 hypothetical protein CLAFUW4_12287 [Fulvia fulva]WPV33003.1 hypothetical protein CLAFUW7_12294 [Fulvia fulva]